MKYSSGPQRLIALSFLLLISVKTIHAEQPYIDIGAMQDPLTPDMRWAYVNVDIPGLGPSGSTLNLLEIPVAHNRLILDTGANSTLFVAEAAQELETRGIVDVGDCLETGVSGTTTYNVSAPYTYQFWGTTNTTRCTISPNGNTQVMYSSAADINGRLEDSMLYAIPGILGMPAMTGRVTTLDMQPWLGESDLSYMDTVFSQNRPSIATHRYSVALRAEPHFDPVPVPEGGQVPVWANVPFATVRAKLGDRSVTGNFLVDTGANSSLVSMDFATSLGLDSNNDGLFDSQDDTWMADATVTGVGGTVTIPIFAVEKLFLPTREGVELAWGSADSPPTVGILDIPGLEGVFGMDMLSNTAWGLNPETFAFVGDPSFRQLHFDFTDWGASGLGTLWLDLSPALDVVVPEPAVWQMLLVTSAMYFGFLRPRRRIPRTGSVSPKFD